MLERNQELADVMGGLSSIDAGHIVRNTGERLSGRDANLARQKLGDRVMCR
jgi:hypothetical protein